MNNVELQQCSWNRTFTAICILIDKTLLKSCRVKERFADQKSQCREKSLRNCSRDLVLIIHRENSINMQTKGYLGSISLQDLLVLITGGLGPTLKGRKYGLGFDEIVGRNSLGFLSFFNE